MPSQRPGVDENGNATCPQLHTSWEYAEDDSERLLPTTSTCGAELYLTWSFSIPFGPTDIVESMEAPSVSVADCWTVECTNGHTLAVSDRNVSVDAAEPANFGVLFGA
jgi:hypothetical protein